MATLVTLTPNLTDSSPGFTVTGAASVDAALADASDASYIETAVGATGTTVVELSTTALPSGCRVMSVQPYVRLATSPSAAGATYQHRFWYPLLPGYVYDDNNSVPTVLTTMALTLRAKTPVGADHSQADIDALQSQITVTLGVGGSTVRIYRAYVEVIYAVQPVVAVTGPASPVTNTSKPVVTWTWTPDPTVGAIQERYEIKVFTAAQYGAGGFSPDTSTPAWTSGEVLSAATSAQIAEDLVNGTTYRAYVRAASQVNGSPHWSAWAFAGFTLSLTPPPAPTLTATADNAHARIALVVTANAGPPTTEYLQVQRSTDGGNTWTDVRGGGRIAPVGVVAVLWDSEGGNGESVLYRARGIDVGLGQDVAGAWSANAGPVAWASDSWWLKAPNRPSLNMAVRPSKLGIPRLTYRRTQAVNVVLGRADPVVLRDVRRLADGDISLITLSAAEREGLARLLDYDGTLLLQTPEGVEFGSRYIEVGDHAEERLAGIDTEVSRGERVTFVEVESPTGDVFSFGATYAELSAAYATYPLLDAAFTDYAAQTGWTP